MPTTPTTLTAARSQLTALRHAAARLGAQYGRLDAHRPLYQEATGTGYSPEDAADEWFTDIVNRARDCDRTIALLTGAPIRLIGDDSAADCYQAFSDAWYLARARYRASRSNRLVAELTW